MENTQVETKLEKKYRFHSEGVVLGNYWGGGKGSYAATKMSADTLEELIEKNEKALKDGSLDSGMGYESLCGALIYITKETLVVIDGETFVSNSYEDLFIGMLTEEEMDFLMNIYLFQ